jgi:hypothetical protein
LLDANIIIEAHMQGVWASLIQRTTIIIPSTVVKEADGYHDDAGGAYIPIHLESALASGMIQEMQATPEQLAALRARFDSVFLQRMDRGESEALALLLAGVLPDARFCTGDGPAIRALSLLQIPDVGISFEAILQHIGFQHRLRSQFTDQFFRDMQARGAQEFIRGEGLRKPPTQSSANKRQQRDKQRRR